MVAKSKSIVEIALFIKALNSGDNVSNGPQKNLGHLIYQGLEYIRDFKGDRQKLVDACLFEASHFASIGYPQILRDLLSTLPLEQFTPVMAKYLELFVYETGDDFPNIVYAIPSDKWQIMLRQLTDPGKFALKMVSDVMTVGGSQSYSLIEPFQRTIPPTTYDGWYYYVSNAVAKGDFLPLHQLLAKTELLEKFDFTYLLRLVMPMVRQSSNLEDIRAVKAFMQKVNVFSKIENETKKFHLELAEKTFPRLTESLLFLFACYWQFPSHSLVMRDFITYELSKIGITYSKLAAHFSLTLHDVLLFWREYDSLLQVKKLSLSRWVSEMSVILLYQAIQSRASSNVLTLLLNNGIQLSMLEASRLLMMASRLNQFNWVMALLESDLVDLDKENQLVLLQKPGEHMVASKQPETVSNLFLAALVLGPVRLTPNHRGYPDMMMSLDKLRKDYEKYYAAVRGLNSTILPKEIHTLIFKYAFPYQTTKRLRAGQSKINSDLALKKENRQIKKP